MKKKISTKSQKSMTITIFFGPKLDYDLIVNPNKVQNVMF